MADTPENPPPDPESDILHRARTGDERAFEQLMRAHYEPIFRLTCSILRDEHEARDACQEAWLTVWRSLKDFRGDSKFSTWLHSIAVRRAVDHLRSRRRWYHRFLPMLPGGDGAPAAPEPAAPDNPREEAERSERRRLFERALAALSAKHRVVLALREVEGLSYEDIAKTLHVRTGTVMSRLFHARRLLVRKLGKLP